MTIAPSTGARAQTEGTPGVVAPRNQSSLLLPATPTSYPTSTAFNSSPSSAQDVVYPDSEANLDMLIDAATPIAVAVSLLIVYCIVRNARKWRQKGGHDRTPRRASQGTKAYFQNKGELDAAGNGIHELSAQETRYDVRGEDHFHEIQGEEMAVEIPSGNERLEGPTLEERHELRSEECSKELGSP